MSTAANLDKDEPGAQHGWRPNSGPESTQGRRALVVTRVPRRLRPAPYGASLRAARASRLRLAVTTNNVALVQRLLEAGTDANGSDDHNRTLLHLASCQGYLDVVRLLVAHGADPNARDSLGNTPLHLAACTSHAPVVVHLLGAGTDMSSLNRHGRSPVQLAQSKLKLMMLRPFVEDADTEKLKAEIGGIVDTMLKCLQLQKEDAAEVEALRSRLEKVNTREQVDNEVSLLLKSLDCLTLSK